jgi:hypothetical protein
MRQQRAAVPDRGEDKAVDEYPSDAHCDHQREHAQGNEQRLRQLLLREPFDDAPRLQTHEHEGEHVDNEDASLPHGVGADAQPWFQTPRRCASQGHGVDHDGDNG